MGFNYKNLDGSIHIGLLNYTRQLQDYAMVMEDENEALKEKLSVSGSRALQDRAEQWSKEWQNINVETGKLKRQLIELAAEKDAEIARLQHEVEWLNEQLEESQARLEEYQTADKPSSQRKRDTENGKFISDIPKKQKMKIAYDMHRDNFSDAQIARRLNVTSSTVRNYISTYSAEQNRKWLEMQSQQEQNKQDYNGVVCYG